MKIYKIIALLLIFLTPNILLAAKIDAKDPYNKLYKKECGCLKIKNKDARYNCIITQFNCGTILETPSCITTDKHFNGYGDEFKDEIDGVQHEINKTDNNLINFFNDGFKLFKSGSKAFGSVIKIIQNGMGLIKDFMDLIQTVTKLFNKLVDFFFTGGRESSCNRDDLAAIFNGNTLTPQMFKNAIEGLNRSKKCFAQAYITFEEGASAVLKIIDRIYDMSNTFLDIQNEGVRMFDKDLTDNRYYDPRQEIKSIETRKLRKIRRKINKSNDDYASEIFFDLKSSISYNKNIKESLSYGFLYTIAKTAKNDDNKTIGKKLNKMKKRRTVNGCEMLKNENSGDSEVAQNADQRIANNKLDIIRAKKCTFYLKKKYNELDKKIQALDNGTKEMIKIIDKQIAKQKSIEDIINRNKKNIAKLRNSCQSNIENYFKNIDKQISYQDNTNTQINKINERKKSKDINLQEKYKNKTKLYKEKHDSYFEKLKKANENKYNREREIANNKLENIKSRIAKIAERETSATTDKETLGNSIIALQNTIAGYELKDDSGENELSRLESALQDAKLELEALKIDRAETKKKEYTTPKPDPFNPDEDELNARNAEREKKKEELKSYNIKIENTIKDIEAKKSEIRAHKKEIRDKKNEKRDAERKLESIKELISKLAEQKADLEKDKTAANKKITELDTEYKNTQEDTDEKEQIALEQLENEEKDREEDLKTKLETQEAKNNTRIGEVQEKYNKKVSKKLSSAREKFIKQMDKFIAEIPKIIDGNVKAIESIKNIDKKYFGGRLGRMRHKHMKVDIKNLQRINSNYGDGKKICKYLLGGKNIKIMRIQESFNSEEIGTFDLTSEILCDERKDIDFNPND